MVRAGFNRLDVNAENFSVQFIVTAGYLSDSSSNAQWEPCCIIMEQTLAGVLYLPLIARLISTSAPPNFTTLRHGKNSCNLVPHGQGQ